MVSVRYPATASKQVGAAVEGMLRRLSKIDGVEVSHGRMVSVSSTDDSPSLAPKSVDSATR